MENNKQKTLIVCGFDSIGKSYFYNHFHNSNVIDADYRNFKYKRVTKEDVEMGYALPEEYRRYNPYAKNVQYPNNYFKYIQKYINKVEVICMNCNLPIIKTMLEHTDIFNNFILIYPEFNEKNVDYYLNLKSIADKEKFIKNLKTRIQNLDNLKLNKENRYKIKDLENEHLSDLLRGQFNYRFDEPYKVTISLRERMTK